MRQAIVATMGRTGRLWCQYPCPTVYTISQRRFFRLPNMTQSFSKSRMVKAPRQTCYNVVLDVETYDMFLPHCKQVEILDHEKMLVRMTIDWKGIHESFDSNVISNEPHEIETVAVHPLFELLQSKWVFTPVTDNTCDYPLTNVDFSISYRFKNPLYNAIMHTVTPHLATTIVDAFERRVLAIALEKGDLTKDMFQNNPNWNTIDYLIDK